MPKYINPLMAEYIKAEKAGEKQAQDFALKCKAKAGEPVDRDARTCFGVHFFDTKEKADAYDIYIFHRGDTYNGGWFHGMACRRDTRFDYINEAGVQLYAVTVA